MKVKNMNAPIGAEIADVDLSGKVDEITFQKIVSAFHARSVIVFRNQSLNTGQQIDFSRRFGDLDINVRSEFNKDSHPEVLVLSNIMKDGKPIGVQDAGRYWHTDLCYLTRPARATILHALEVPMNGNESLGDTLFSSMTHAYDALPDNLKEKLSNLKAVQSYKYTYEKKARDFKLRPTLAVSGDSWIPGDVVHEAVRKHPYTGQKCLYVNEGYTTRLIGLPESESDALIQFLISHASQPQFQYAHKWRTGDFLMWDNCLVQHKATSDYKLPQRRLMERTTVLGSENIGIPA